MSTKQSYQDKYGTIIAVIVLSSRALVGVAGRSGDQEKIGAAQNRHEQLMEIRRALSGRIDEALLARIMTLAAALR
jgi:hypothetical protein